MAFAVYQHVSTTEHLAAASRTTTGGISSGPTYASAASIDLTTVEATIQAIVSAGTVATSLDLKWQESADNATWSDVSNGSSNAITQLTAAPTGCVTLEKSVRSFTKRYARLLATVGGTCVFSVVCLTIPRRQ